MTPRGPYAKGVAKRAEILSVALDVIERNGYSGATVKELADAVGLSQNGLLHYFGSKDALFLEILRFHDTAVDVEIDPDHTDFTRNLHDRILGAMSEVMSVTGRSQLLLSLTADATADQHLAHDYIGARMERFREVTADALERMQRDGRFPPDGDPAAAAMVLAAAFDGLQTEWLYDRSLDIRAAMSTLLRALGIAEDNEPVNSGHVVSDASDGTQ